MRTNGRTNAIHRADRCILLMHILKAPQLNVDFFLILSIYKLLLLESDGLRLYSTRSILKANRYSPFIAWSFLLQIVQSKCFS